jgi:hypothetical protein
MHSLRRRMASLACRIVIGAQQFLGSQYPGFEDLCVLNGKRTDQKYNGRYDTSPMKRFKHFANSQHGNEDL